MIYFSEKTLRGNIGMSWSSQAEANKQAAAMDAGNCVNCAGCEGCARHAGVE